MKSENSFNHNFLNLSENDCIIYIYCSDESKTSMYEVVKSILNGLKG